MISFVFGISYIAARPAIAALLVVGTQFGFSLKTSDGVNFAFAAENPLTGVSVLNNCYCDFDISAKKASQLTNSENTNVQTATKNDITISIKLSKKHGSTSYYVARVYKLNS